MNDAERYNAEFEQLMREVQADAESAQNRDREMMWKAMEKPFDRMADAHKWTAEQRAAKKQYFLEHCLD